MYIKVIDPRKSNVNYQNVGSSARCSNYLTSVKHFPDKNYTYFNNYGVFTREQVVEAIDNNVKGLKSYEDYIRRIENGEEPRLREYQKFTSLNISPSQEEILLFRENPEMEVEYVSQVMDDYASNFHMKKRNGDELSFNKEDLVWFAIRHDERVFKSNDKDVLEGRAEEGSVKEGDNMHWHIIVSNRDKQQKYTINPIGCKMKTFNRNEWSYNGIKDFYKMYDQPESLRMFLDKVGYGLFSKFENELKFDMTREYLNVLNDGNNGDVKIDMEMIEKLEGFTEKNIDTLFLGLQTTSRFKRNSFNVKNVNDFVESYLLGLNYGGKVRYYSGQAQYTFNSTVGYIKEKHNIEQEVKCSYVNDKKYDTFQALVNLKKKLDDGYNIKDLGSFLDRESEKLMNDNFLLFTIQEVSELKENNFKGHFINFAENFNEFYGKDIDIDKLESVFYSYHKYDSLRKEGLSTEKREYYQEFKQRLHKGTRLLMSDIYNGFFPKNPTEKLIDYSIGFSKYGISDFNLMDEGEKFEKIKELTRYLNEFYKVGLNVDVVENLYRREEIGDDIYKAIICFKNSLDNEGRFKLGNQDEYEVLTNLDVRRNANERLLFITENIKDFHDKDFQEYFQGLQGLAIKHDKPEIVKEYLKNLEYGEFSLLSEDLKSNVVGNLIAYSNVGKEEIIDYDLIKNITDKYGISERTVFSTLKSYPEEYLTEERLVNSLMQFGNRGKEKLYLQGDESVLDNLVDYVNREYYGKTVIDKSFLKDLLEEKPRQDIFQSMINLKGKLENGEVLSDPVNFIVKDSENILRNNILYISNKDWQSYSDTERAELFNEFLNDFESFYKLTGIDYKNVAQISSSHSGWLNKAAGYLLNEKVYFGDVQDINKKITDYVIGFSKYGRNDFLNLDHNQQLNKLSGLTGYLNKHFDVNINFEMVKDLFQKETEVGNTYQALVELKDYLDKEDRFEIKNFEAYSHEIGSEFFDIAQKSSEHYNDKLKYIANNLDIHYDKEFEVYFNQVKEIADKYNSHELVKDYLKGIPIESFFKLSPEMKDIINKELLDSINHFKEVNIVPEKIFSLMSEHNINSNTVYLTLKKYPEKYLTEEKLVNSLMQFSQKGKERFYLQGDESVLENLVDYINSSYYQEEGKLDSQPIKELSKNNVEDDVFQAILNLKSKLEEGEAIDNPFDFVKGESAQVLRHDVLYLSNSNWGSLDEKEKYKMFLDYIEKFKLYYNQFDINTPQLRNDLDTYSKEWLNKAAGYLLNEKVYFGDVQDINKKITDYVIGFSKYGRNDFLNLDHNQQLNKLSELTGYLNKHFDANINFEMVKDLFQKETEVGNTYQALVELKHHIENKDMFKLTNFEGYSEELKKDIENLNKSFQTYQKRGNEILVFIAENVNEYKNIDFEKYYDKIESLSNAHGSKDLLKDFLKNLEYKDFMVLNENNRHRALHDLVLSINKDRMDKISFDNIYKLVKENDISDISLFATLKNYPEEYLTEEKLVNSLMQFSPKGKEKLYVQGDESILESLAGYINEEYYKSQVIDVGQLKKFLKDYPDLDIFQALINLKGQLDRGEVINDPFSFIEDESKKLLRHELLYKNKTEWEKLSNQEKEELIKNFVDSYNNFYDNKISSKKLLYIINNLYQGDDRFNDFLSILKSSFGNNKFGSEQFDEYLIDNYAGLAVFSFDKFKGLTDENKKIFIKNYVELLNKFYLGIDEKLNANDVIEMFEDKDRYGDNVFKGLSRFKFLLNNGHEFQDSLKEVERLSTEGIKQSIAESMILGALNTAKRMKSLQLDEGNTFRDAFELFRTKRRTKNIKKR